MDVSRLGQSASRCPQRLGVQVCDGEQVKPPPKRRRILDASAVVSVPVYSNKVSSSLRLQPMASVFTGHDNSDDGLWSRFSSRVPAPNAVELSDSEEDDAEPKNTENVERSLKNTWLSKEGSPDEQNRVLCFRTESCCPSPPESPEQKQSRQVQRKLSEADRKLRAVNSFLSPERPDRKSFQDDDDEDDDDDVNPSGLRRSPYSSALREIPLKIRCRTDVHKILVQSSTPLSDVLTQLSVVLAVPPPRLLLLRKEEELPLGATVGELGLGIADILECVVMAAEDDRGVTVRLQSKDRAAAQEFTLQRDCPLGSIFSLYLSPLPPAAQKKVRFLFDGGRVAPGQTPAQLELEDGDIIEVWL
ncbi:NFATC2-interacting protein isoform X2 [Pseudoliparis swirei]|uniref:NFATC2-interacting protein isoform X2 n=1 Tax=Pseudoliparis swirei TaxID=2059687 RepID=UPI0024BE2E58|nr:NFATC2-interacting protein isoform X2 [Pseudoliparis swirei]